MNNLIDKSTTTHIYSMSYRHSMNKQEEVQKINEALKVKKQLETIYKGLPTVAFKDLVVGAEYGLAYSNNNSQYYDKVKVIVVNPKSARVQFKVTKDSEGYFGHVTVINKSTIKNRIFDLKEFNNLPEELDQCERLIDDYMRGKINEIVGQRIAAAEEQQKKEGVYTSSTTYKIDFNYPGYLRKIADNKEISV